MSRSSSTSIHHWTTRLTRQFPCRIPVLGAPMANCAGGALAAAVASAGGLGFVGAGHALDSEVGLTQLEQEIQIFRAASSANEKYPLCLGFIGYSTFRSVENWKRLELVLERHRPSVVQFFAPVFARAPLDFYNTMTDSEADFYKRDNVTLCHKYDAQVVAQVGTVQDALEAVVEYGVDALMVQGSEAGGHGLRPQQMGNATLPLAVTVVSQLRAHNNDTPVVAAGGIADGRTMAAFLAAGCDGVVLGTRLWGSHESLGHASYKDRLVAPETTCDQVTRTPIFDWIQNTYSNTPWPEPYDTVGALRNSTTKQWQGREHELKEALLVAESSSEKKNSNDRNDDGASSSNNEASSLSRIAHDYRQACEQGDANIALIHAGQGVGLMDAVEPAADLVTRISLEAEAILRSAPAQLFTTTQRDDSSGRTET